MAAGLLRTARAGLTRPAPRAASANQRPEERPPPGASPNRRSPSLSAAVSARGRRHVGAGEGGGAGPGAARGLAGHRGRWGGAAGAPPAPLVPSGRAVAELPRAGAAQAAAGGSLDGEAGLVRGLRQRGHPG